MEPKTNITVKLSGTDGNVFAILGKVRSALIRGGRVDLVAEFIADATSGDYDHAIQTAMKYVEVT